MPAVDSNKSWFGARMNVCLDPKDVKTEHYIYARLTNTMRCPLTHKHGVVFRYLEMFRCVLFNAQHKKHHQNIHVLAAVRNITKRRTYTP